MAEKPANTAVTVRTTSGVPGALTLLSDRYELLEVLGSGGCGTVYRAYDQRLEEFVALKLLHDVGPEAAQQLRQEVKVSRRVSHRNVVRVFDIGDDGDQRFLTMELVDGESLATRLARTRALPLTTFLHVARQIASGVAAAHFAGIAHRDLKPANVLLRMDEAKVTDFGIARSYATGRDFSGTPAYMAPEQITTAEGTSRSDVYSLGVLFYEMLAGERPFLEDRLLAAHEERLRRGALDVTAVRPDADEAIVALVRACTELEPSVRPASAAEVRDVLNSVPVAGRRAGARTGRLEDMSDKKLRADTASGFRYGWLAAADRMKDALERAPDNPAFLSWLAIALSHGISFDWLAEDENIDRAREAADRAAALAPDAALPRVAQGAIRRALADHAGAAEAFSAALARDPSSPDANHFLGDLLAACGDLGAGLSHLATATLLDPTQSAFAWSLARAYVLQGDFEAFTRVDALPDDAAQLSSYWAARHETMAFMPEERLRADFAAVDAGAFDLRPAILAAVQIFLGETHEHEGMLAILREIGTAGSPRALRRRDRMRRYLADICARFGRPEAALDALEDCDRAATIELVWLKKSPALAPVRKSARYRAVLERTEERAAAVLQAARRAPT